MAPAKKTRTSDVVSTSVMEELLNRIKNARIGEGEALVAIGYKNPSSLLVEARRVGLVKRVVVMGLRGFIAEKGLDAKTPQVFALSGVETEELFDALRAYRREHPNCSKTLQVIQGRLAAHMMKVEG